MGRKKANDNTSSNNVIFESSKVNGRLDEEFPSDPTSVTRKKKLSKTITDEFNYLKTLFDVLDIADLNNGRKGAIDDDDDEDLELPDIPEKKVFKKTPSKKGPAQSAGKNKPFPQTVEELEKELEELKGTPMNYQKKLRKKGLQTRLTKKKRKESLKQSKELLKQEKKLNRPGKLIKPVLNSDGNVVSNKFDFADNELKKETKRKHTTSINEFKDQNESNKKFKSSPHSNIQMNNKGNQQIKTEPNDVGGSNKILIEDVKPKLNNGPLFNKDNKMVFSKVLVSDKTFRKPKTKTEKDPKKILQKIKDDSKKISELENQDIEKALILKEKQKWSTALKRASGEKVKDDPDLLKKSIQREKSQKMKSKKKWEERIERVQKDKDDRQKKRKDNIQARIQENKKRKMKRAVKKGRFIQL